MQMITIYFVYVFLSTIISHIPIVSSQRNDERFIKLSRSSPSAYHGIVFAVKQNNVDKLEQLLKDRSTPGKDQYQQWLQVNDIDEITRNERSLSFTKSWLESNNITMVHSSQNDNYIHAFGMISVWESSLQTKFYVSIIM